MHNLLMRIAFKTLAPLAALALPFLASAQVPRNRAPLPNEQWVRLFNGKDLTTGFRSAMKSGPWKTAPSTAKA